MARNITIGAATQIGRLEYELFADWYGKTYGTEPPKNDASIGANPYYVWWKANLRSSVWSPQVETQSTVELFKQSGVPANAPYNPPPQLDTTGTTQGNMPEVVSQGGYDWYPIKDPTTGEIVTWELIGKTPNASDDWSRDFQERQFNYQQEQDRLALERQRLGTQMDRAGAERQRLVNWSMQPSESDKQREKAAWWEELRTQMMNELQSIPSQWLNYQQLKIKENPYTVNQSASDRLAAAQERTEVAKGLLKEARDREKTASTDPGISLTPEDKAFIEFARNEYQAATDVSDKLQREANTGYQLQDTSGGTMSQSEFAKAIRDEYGRDPTANEMEGYWAAPRDTGGGNKAVGMESAPKPISGVATPDWLGKGLVSQLKGQQWIPGTGNVGGKLTEVNPLSGQAVNRLTPTQLEMLKGMVSFTGQEPSDWLYQASVQAPRNISLGRTWR